LKPFAKCIFALLELLHLFLQIITYPFDARERPLAGE
jgi:hypothetical protein